MDKLKAIIADDEFDALEILSNLLVDSGKVDVIATLSDPLKIESLVQKHHPDILFLDIEMPLQNGMAVLRNIREYNQELLVVFTTAHEKYISEAIKLNVFSYLQKPIDRQELKKLIDKMDCLRMQGNLNKVNTKIKLPISDGYVFIKTEELFLLEAEGNYTRIKTINGDVFVSSYNMGRLYERLDSSKFYRINRACILNAQYIYKINKKKQLCNARLNGNEHEFELSKSFLIQFNKYFN